MKKILISSTFIILLVPTFFIMPRHHYTHPGKYVAGYSNMVTQISYAADSDNQHTVSLHCDTLPIAYYAPESYADFSKNNNIQSYLLPRTDSVDITLDGFYKEMQDRLKSLGILFNIDTLSGKFSGLRINFTTESGAYQINKNIDEDAKTVRFTIVPKNKM